MPEWGGVRTGLWQRANRELPTDSGAYFLQTSSLLIFRNILSFRGPRAFVPLHSLFFGLLGALGFPLSFPFLPHLGPLQHHLIVDTK
jgi:hypothetical protein